MPELRTLRGKTGVWKPGRAQLPTRGRAASQSLCPRHHIGGFRCRPVIQGGANPERVPQPTTSHRAQARWGQGEVRARYPVRALPRCAAGSPMAALPARS